MCRNPSIDKAMSVPNKILENNVNRQQACILTYHLLYKKTCIRVIYTNVNV